MPLLLPLLLVTALGRAEEPIGVRLPLSAVQALLAPRPLPDALPEALVVERLLVEVSPDLQSDVKLTLDLWVHDVAGRPPQLAIPVAGAALVVRQAQLDGRRVDLPLNDQDQHELVADLRPGAHRLVVSGTMDTPQGALTLGLPNSVRSELRVRGDWQVDISGGIALGGGRFALPPAPAMAFSWREPTALAPRPQVIRASVATALRVDSTGIEGRAALRWTVRNQPTDTLEFRLGTVEALLVEGPLVASSTQQGDRVVVKLREAVEGDVALTVTFRAPPPGAGAMAPLPLPVSTTGGLDEGWLAVLNGGSGIVVPRADGGLEAVPTSALPAWGRGLVDGGTIAALRITGRTPALHLGVFDFAPADSPPTFVDEARIEVAYADHGRALLRCQYQVRNDKSQYLRVHLPQNSKLLGVRVAGTVVQPVRDGDDLLVPLEKSIETLSGLVSFPVEVLLFSSEAAWTRKGHRELRLPGVDAPVAHARLEVVLPPGMESREVSGVPSPVAQWTDGEGGLAYGRAVGGQGLDEGEALERETRSQESWNLALRAYQDNEFEVAQGLLEQSLAWDENNEAAAALMGNVNVLLGEADAAADDSQARRVRAMARAKTSGASTQQLQLKEQCEEALRAGDYETARSTLEALEQVTNQLVLVEDKEAVDQKQLLEDTRSKLELAKNKTKRDESPTQDSAEGVGSRSRSTSTSSSSRIDNLKSADIEVEDRDADGLPDSRADSGPDRFVYQLEALGYLDDDDGRSLDEDQQVQSNRSPAPDNKPKPAAAPMAPPPPPPPPAEVLSEELMARFAGASEAENVYRYENTYGVDDANTAQADELVMVEKSMLVILTEPAKTKMVSRSSNGEVSTGAAAHGAELEAKKGDASTPAEGRDWDGEGGVEGGVVGGIIGGVKSGKVAVSDVTVSEGGYVLDGVYAPDPEPARGAIAAATPEAPAQIALSAKDHAAAEQERTSEVAKPAIDTESTASSVTVTKEFLQRIPTGRSYQSAVEISAGVTATSEGVQPGDRGIIIKTSQRKAPKNAWQARRWKRHVEAAQAKRPPQPVTHRPPVGPVPTPAPIAAWTSPAHPVGGSQSGMPVGAPLEHVHPLAPAAPPPPDTYASTMDPAVSAAPLTLRIPLAGERLRFEQQLLAPDQSLTLTIRYRTRRTP
jgi:hypothetical protein